MNPGFAPLVRGLIPGATALLLAGAAPLLTGAEDDGPGSRASLAVGSAVARPGETAYGDIRVPAGVEAFLDIPVAVVHGARPGPIVSVVAGVHGTEYASVVALTRLIGRVDPRTLAGSLIVVPLANPPSFERMRVHDEGVGPLPGDPKGALPLRVARALAEQVVKPAAVVIDLHGGDLDEDALPHSFWLRIGDPAQDLAGQELVLAFGLDHIVIWDIDLATRGGIESSLAGHALRLGKAAFAAAVGRTGQVAADDLAAMEDGLFGVLASLRMIDRDPRPLDHPVWLDGRKRVNAEGPGMFFATVARGATVSEGMKIGFITDSLGRTAGDVRSPATGVVLYVRGVPSMWKGANLIMVGPVMSRMRPYTRPPR